MYRDHPSRFEYSQDSVQISTTFAVSQYGRFCFVAHQPGQILDIAPVGQYRSQCIEGMFLCMSTDKSLVGVEFGLERISVDEHS